MPITISIVIPVYRGEKSLPKIVEELVPFTLKACLTPHGLEYIVHEVVLVHDCGPDRSDLVIEECLTPVDAQVFLGVPGALDELRFDLNLRGLGI